MKIFKPQMLARPLSGNGLLTFFASIAFGSFAFATSNIEISQPFPSEVVTNTITNVEKFAPEQRYSDIANAADSSTLALLNPEGTHELTLPPDSGETLLEPGSGSSATEPMATLTGSRTTSSTDEKVQQTLVLVLLSVLAGDR